MSAVTFDTGITGWRIADGILKRGRGREGEATLDMIDGKLVRIGVHEGTAEDGTPYKQIECDLETEDGLQFVKAAIGLKDTASNVTPAQFGMALLECAKGEWIAIRPKRSDQAHEKWGTYTTFVNVGIVNPETLRARQVSPDAGRFAGDSYREKLPHILKELESHPAFAARPNRDETDAPDLALQAPNEGLTNYRTVLKDKQWPGLDLAEAEHLVLAQKVGKTQYADVDDVPSAIWQAMADSAKKATKMPDALQRIADSLKDDPFADE